MKTAVIIGGTGAIGSAVSEKFSSKNYKVICIGRTTKKNLNEFYVCNLLDVTSIKETSKKILEKYKKIDVLVNCAGINDGQELKTLNENSFYEVIKTNINGTLFFSKYLLPGLKGGSIVSVSSIKANSPTKGVAYGASKAALNNITINLANQLSKHKIRVNAVAPGYTATGMISAKERALKAKKTIIGRLANPKEIAQIIFFVAAEATYINGQIITADS